MAKDYSKPKYAMGISAATTSHHPGYSDKLSAEANVKKGYRKAHKYKKVFKQLNQLANLTHKPVFREAADLAERKAHKAREFKEDRERAR